MKKFFVLFAVFTALIFVVSCGEGAKTGDSTDTGEGLNDEDSETSDSATSDPTEQMEEGIYLGIIGFNYKLNPRPIEILTNTNMTEFQKFIDDFEMDDGTALYFADYTALKMMRDYNSVPPKLQTVALVTFTDGEDTSSDGEKNDPEHYNDPEKYLDEISKKIKNENIHGFSVEAYSIGLKSGDTGSDFKSRLEKLASSSDNAFEVSDMEEVKERFTEIAENLYSVFKTINIKFSVLGNYSDGTRMRFSLDIYCDHDENECERNGKNSNLYIDATYRRNGSERSFENFAYHGFSGNLETVKCGDRDPKGFYPCIFENLQYDNMDTKIKQIELWKNDNNEWKHENEALKQEDSNINESKSSALIMLVLDCTTSLGNSKFKKLQEAGKDFIETLVNGGSSVTTTLPECSASSGTPCKDSSSGLTWSAKASSSMTWDNAKSYCDSYSEDGLSGWHLPTIDELRTLLINADSVKNNCQVSETNNCLSYADCWSCSTCTQTGTQSSSGTGCSDWGTSYSDGRYSKFGEIGYFWSSSTTSDHADDAWYVLFYYGIMNGSNKTSNYDVRCVR